jgi:hypothetical protein
MSLRLAAEQLDYPLDEARLFSRREGNQQSQLEAFVAAADGVT